MTTTNRAQPHSFKLLLAMLIFAGTQAFAAGTVAFVSGPATVVNAAGDIRTVNEKMRIDNGDTVVTGKKGEVHIITDDRGLIAMRPESRLRIDDYAANGDEKDRAVHTLLQGFMRAVTGWIGKVAPRNYRVHVATATVGIRGTDHEAGLVEDGEGAGAYSKVNEGETILSNPGGEVSVRAGRAAVAEFAKPSAPRLLDRIPPIFVPTANESLIDATRNALAADMDERLRQRREEIKRSGGIDAAGNTRINESCIGGATPIDELMEFIRAYEAGNPAMLQKKLDPSMLGYQRFMDGLIQDFNRQKQIRLFIKDVQVQCGTDLATVQFTWEKRYLDVASFEPGFLTGRGITLMHRGADYWRIAGFAGDNPFSSLAGTLGQLTFGPSFSLSSVSAIPRSIPVTVQVVDSDLAGLGSLTVQIVTTLGDAESVVLPETSPGRFMRNSLTLSSGAVAQGNGVIEVATGVQLILRYVDQNPGNNLPPTMLTQVLRPTGSILIAPDTTPDPFSFIPVSNATASTATISNSAIITGINAPTSITIVGGEYSIDNGAFTAAGGTVSNGQQIRLRVTASPLGGGVASATVNVGGVTAIFSVTTALQSGISTPAPFSYNPQANVALSTPVDSLPVTISGINVAVPVSITGGQYSINGGAFTTAAGTITNGQTLTVRVISAATFGTTTSATVNVGGMTAIFSVTTAPQSGISTPAPFSYSPQTNVPQSTLIDSLPAVISGITVASPVTIVGGLYAINNGAFTAAAGSITSGQTLTVRVLSAATFGTTTSATVNVGGMAATFSVTTAGGITTPKAFSFTPQANVPPRTTVTSNAVAISGINTPAPVSISGGTYSINGGAFTAAPGSILNNQTIAVQLTSSIATDGTGSAVATVNIGGVFATFNVTTWDTTPNAFAFFTLVTARTGVPVCLKATSQYTTASIVVTGLTAAAPVSLSALGPNPGATMSINGGAFTAGPATIANGQTLAVTVNTVGIATGATPVTRATVNIGGVTANVTQTCN